MLQLLRDDGENRSDAVRHSAGMDVHDDRERSNLIAKLLGRRIDILRPSGGRILSTPCSWNGPVAQLGLDQHEPLDLMLFVLYRFQDDVRPKRRTVLTDPPCMHLQSRVRRCAQVSLWRASDAIVGRIEPSNVPVFRPTIL